MDLSPDATQSLQGSPVRPSTAAACAGGAGGKDDDAAVAVRVAVHIRPLVENELAKGCQEILDVTPNTPQISVGSHRFTYDNVYGSGGGDSAANLYPDCVQPLVDGLFKGYNATVFAYGQTGSGKTYTMGSAWSPDEDEDNQGVIPSVMDELFTRVEHEAHTDFTIKVSFVEIHKEEVRDLLWANSSAPRPVVTIRELPTGVSLSGACERQVSSREEMSHVLMQGTLMRAVAATNMNNRSSRSHAIFTITVEQRKRQMVRPASAPPAVESTPRRSGLQDGDASSSSDEVEDSAEDEEEMESGDEYLIAKMHLVDLAGSERAKRTGAEGARLREAININKGLLALAKVITALVDGQSHVPYRDSKLTRLLQDSLGGNSRTVMIACVSPADINREETLNTLRYADRARRIKNKPVVNRDPMAAQLSALRQQIAGLRAENLALRTALGGDKEAASAIAAAGRGTTVASAALQEAYDDLAVRFHQLELENAKQQMQLESNQEEMKLLRSGLLTAETQRDQLLLRLQALQSAASASSDTAMKEALAQDSQAAAAAADGPPGSSPTAAARAAAEADGAATAGSEAAAGADAPAAGLLADVGVVQMLRTRVAELETELRQVRSLQRMASSVFVRGINSSLCSSSLTTRGLSSRQNSSSGGFGPVAGHGHAGRAVSRLAGHHIGDISEGGSGPSSNGMFGCDDHGLDGDLSPVTPARPSGMCGGDMLGDPLMEVAPDAEILAQSAAHMMAREELALKLEVLGRQMEAKQKRLLALQSAADIEGAKSKYMQELQKERDTLAKEKTALLQKLAAVTQAGAEERKRLEQTYKDKLTSVEKRLKDLAEREKAAKRNAAQLGRVQSVCQQLQADIARMKAQRAAVQRRMEAKEKEFREWRLSREREVIQLRRNAQRQNAALQQHQAMHSKQQAVLKRKTEEAEAARRKLRELTELQARVRRDKQALHAAAAGDGTGGAGADMELQPNASAPLLRTSKARREWIDQEMELCSTSWQYQKVLEGELAQRADATRKLREVQKQLMLLGGLVPPSPVVTAAAAAAARGRRNSNNLQSGASGGGSSSGGMAEEAALMQEAKALQDAIDSHTRSVKELQEQWERARAEEQSRGAGAADVRRWTGIRNIVEAREMLRTLFISACAQRAQVCESQMDLAKLQESNDILEIRLDMAVQQAAEARRKALEAEATAAAVITTPAHFAAAVAAAGRGSSDGSSDGEGADAAGAVVGAEGAMPGAQQQLQHQRSSRRLRQQELLSGGSASSVDELAERRDPVDIEADSLLHSLGLPSIQEMPSPAEDCSTGDAGQQAAAGSGAAAGGSGRLTARRERQWGRAASSSSRSTSALARAAAEGWPSQDGADVPRRPSGGVPSRRSSSTALDLAAKLDALEGEWQGYKRTAAAAAASGNTRRSLSGGGSVWPGSRRSSSVPASPRCDVAGGSAAAALQGGTPRGPPGSRQSQQQQQQRGRRVSLSANNSPLGRADAWASQDGDAAAGEAGGAQRGSDHNGDQQQQGLLLRSISSIFKLGRDAVAAMGVGSGARSPLASDTVVKSLDFQDADDRVGRCPAQTPSGTPRTSRRRSASSRSPDRAAGRARPRDAQHKNWQQQLRQQDRPSSGGLTRAGAGKASTAGRAGDSNQTDDEIFHLDSCDGEDEGTSGARGSRRRGDNQAMDASGTDSDEFEDAEEDGDNEEGDPSYDPALHGTPAAARRSSRQPGRQGRSRAARGSVSSEQDAASGGNTSRASSRSRRSSSHQQQQQQQQSTSGAGAATAAAMARNLAAQVSFNHEKRQGWERPVLEDINNRRAGQGLAPVDKLTIQLLKENLVGQELDGKPWAPGNKTKDILIADYRRVLQLSERDEDVTSINRITGAANWPMPGSLPSSLPTSPQPGSWAAAARRGADAEAAAVAEGGHSRPGSAATGARRVLSHSLPPSPSGRDPYRAANVAGSPLRALQQQSRIPAGVNGGSSSSRPQGGAPSPMAAAPPSPFANGGKSGSPPEPGSPPLGASPNRGAPQRMTPSPRVVREQWGAAGDSPRVGGPGGSRGLRAGRRTFVSQSVDGSLLQAGAAREQQAQMAALQQGPQRTLRSNSSSSSSNAPGSAAKLQVVIPQTTRIDGPYSNRMQQPATAGSNPAGSSERLRSASGQPNWR